jgi:hypothetical protein
LVPGLLELYESSISGKTSLRDSTVNVVDFRDTLFTGPLEFVENSHGGLTLLSGVRVEEGVLFDHESLADGIDLHHAEIGTTWAPVPPIDAAAQMRPAMKQDASVRVENSFVGGAILFQGSTWSDFDGSSATLHVNATTFDKIELHDWQTFKRIAQPPSGPYASRDVEERVWTEYLAFLRTMEAGYIRDGYTDLAESADLYRIKLEANRGGLWKLTAYWFLDLSCKHGYELERIPLAWIVVIVSFAIVFMYYSKRFRKHARTFHRRRCMHRFHDLSEDLSCSFLALFNLKRTLGNCYPRDKRAHAHKLMHVERLVGIIILFISAALTGAFLSK